MSAEGGIAILHGNWHEWKPGLPVFRVTLKDAGHSKAAAHAVTSEFAVAFLFSDHIR